MISTFVPELHAEAASKPALKGWRCRQETFRKLAAGKQYFIQGVGWSVGWQVFPNPRNDKALNNKAFVV